MPASDLSLGPPSSSESTVAKAQSSRVWERTSEDQMIPKETLAKEIAAILKERRLTQIEAAYLAGDAPSQLSLIVSGKLRGFSTDRLARILLRLGRDIEIVIRPSRGGRKVGAVRLARR